MKFGAWNYPAGINYNGNALPPDDREFYCNAHQLSEDIQPALFRLYNSRETMDCGSAVSLAR